MGEEQLNCLDQQLVALRINQANYAIAIHNIQEIVRIQIITRVPNTPKHVDGVINLRGTVVPVLNLHQLFGMAKQEETEDSRIAVIKVDNVLYGIIVDQASEVLHLSSGTIEAAPEVNTQNQRDYILGVANSGSELWIILDPKALVLFFNNKAVNRG
jgi:purine-binding chemotaxis protein CheW